MPPEPHEPAPLGCVQVAADPPCEGSCDELQSGAMPRSEPHARSIYPEQVSANAEENSLPQLLVRRSVTPGREKPGTPEPRTQNDDWFACCFDR